MINSGFIDRLGEENVRSHIAAALAQARVILKLPPVHEHPEPHEVLFSERQAVELAPRELTESLEQAQQILKTLDRRADKVTTRQP